MMKVIVGWVMALLLVACDKPVPAGSVDSLVAQPDWLREVQRLFGEFAACIDRHATSVDECVVYPKANCCALSYALIFLF